MTFFSFVCLSLKRNESRENEERDHRMEREGERITKTDKRTWPLFRSILLFSFLKIKPFTF